MFSIIKTDKYDKLVNDLMHYFYFAFQFAFVISGTAIVRLTYSTYNFSTIFIKLPFILIVICDFYKFLRGKFSKNELIFYITIGIVLIISYFNYRKEMVLANLIMIAAFSETDGKRALKYYLLATISAFIITLILGVLFPNIGNVIQVRDGVEKERLGLGFFYASLGQFYFLSILLAYILYKEKINIYEGLVFVILDVLLFKFTNTRAPFFYTLLTLVLYYILNYCKNNIIYNIFGIVSILSPIIACAGMTLMSWFYTADNAILFKINSIVNGRLLLTHNTLRKFGVKLFGQRVPEALGDPQYYLDSSLMVLVVLFGIAVTIICILFMTYFAYIAYKTKKITILLVIFIISLRGAFDLGFMAIQFSPVVLLFVPTLKEYLNKRKL